MAPAICYSGCMVRVTISLSEELYQQLAAQAQEICETPEEVAAQIVSERLLVPHSSPEVRAIIARQLRDYEWLFDRLAE